MAERRAGVLRLGERAFGAEELLVMGIVPAGSMERVDAAVAEGADLVEIGDPVGSFVAAVREAYPELVVGVRAGRPEVAREAGAAGADLLSGSGAWVSEVAASFGIGVAGPLAGAARAVAAGVAAERVIVAGGGGLAEAVGSGWPVLASFEHREEVGQLAAMAVAAWLGARVFRVDQVRAARRALRMVSAIRGDIPPACAVRGLGLWRVARRTCRGPAGAAEWPGMETDDPYDLRRFVAAQDAGGTYQRAAAELRNGRKTSHWMWFIFPQIAGLGYSPAAQAYAISGLAEARAYLAHPVLGARLTECAAILAGLPGRTPEHVLGEVDALKLRSSMTLFMRAAPGEPVFRQVLDQYFDGVPDPATEQRL
jgi:uncharacterized protein (DUF1810 family)